MLKGLDLIEWQSLNSFSGPSTRIPEWLTVIASDDASTRQQALDKLRGEIYHQGDVGEVTAYVVPFLIQLLAHPEIQDKAIVLELVARLTTSWVRVRNRLRQKGSLNNSGYPQSHPIRTSEEFARRVYQAVRKGLKTFLSLLSDPLPAVRCEAVHTLSFLTEEGADTVPLVLQCVRNEKDKTIQAIMLWYLGNLIDAVLVEQEATRLSGYKASFTDLCTALLDSETEVLTQFSAAVSLVRVMGESATDKAIAYLVHAIGSTNKYPTLPWGEIISTDVSRALCKLGLRKGHITLIDALNDVTDVDDAHILVAALLALVIEGRTDFEWSLSMVSSIGPDGIGRREYHNRNSITKLGPLTPEQEHAIAAIVRCDKFWEVHNNLLSLYGLPDSRKELHGLLQ